MSLIVPLPESGALLSLTCLAFSYKAGTPLVTASLVQADDNRAEQASAAFIERSQAFDIDATLSLVFSCQAGEP